MTLLCLVILLFFSKTVSRQSVAESLPSKVVPAYGAPVTLVATRTFLCPSGDQASDDYCQGQKSVQHTDMDPIYNSCVDDFMCFRGMQVGSARLSRCCGKLNQFCPGTGLHAWHSSGPEGYLYDFIPSLNKTQWYKRDYNEAGNNGVACPIPYSFGLKQKGEDLHIPVGWDENRKKAEKNEPFEQQRCLTNSECGEGNFCDAVWNPTYPSVFYLDRSDNGKPVWFCFKLPKLPENMKHVEFDKGMKICNTHLDCNNPTQICHDTQGVSYGNVSSPSTRVSGICVHVDACNANDAQVRGVLNANSQLCTDDNSCEGAGIASGSSDYNPHCREYFRPDSNRRVCCFEKNPECRLGKAVTPLKKCNTMTDCTGDLKKNPWNTWCDDTGLNICCKDLDNRLWQCPDLATPLFNEPPCTGSTIDNKASGTCPTKSGICHYGHCCPPLIVTENGTKIILGKRLYQTKFPCDVSRPVPPLFSYAFCNPKTSMLVIVGRFHENGEKMTKVSAKKCTLNDDCSFNGSLICVYENEDVHMCYNNPMYSLRPTVSRFWKIVLTVSLICAMFFLIISVISFVCYRSKSVFDVRKKSKGKKKKGGDGSGSDRKKKKKGKEDDSSYSKTLKRDLADLFGEEPVFSRQ